MPTYDYECRDCGNTVEVIHGMTEEGPTTCAVCGGSLRRVLYPAGIIFKGSGFYSTDSRSAGSSASSSSTGRGGKGTGKAKGSGSPDASSGSSSAGNASSD